jgi:hypothetical protein
MPKIDISRLPYDAHLDYARRVEGLGVTEETAPVATAVAVRIESVREIVFLPDSELDHFMSVGRPQTKAFYGGPPANHKVREAYIGDSSLLRLNPARTWNGLDKRHPTLLLFLQLLKALIKEHKQIFKGRHELLEE